MRTVKNVRALQELKKALTVTHNIEQNKMHFHYRAGDITDYKIIGNDLNCRQALSLEGQVKMKEAGMDFLDTVLVKAYELGMQAQKSEFQRKLDSFSRTI